MNRARFPVLATVACGLTLAACAGDDGRTDPLRTGALMGLLGAGAGVAGGAIARGNQQPAYHYAPPPRRPYRGQGYNYQPQPAYQDYGRGYYRHPLPPMTPGMRNW